MGSFRRVEHGEKERVSESSGEVGAVGLKPAAPASLQGRGGKATLACRFLNMSGVS